MAAPRGQHPTRRVRLVLVVVAVGASLSAACGHCGGDGSADETARGTRPPTVREAMKDLRLPRVVHGELEAPQDAARIVVSPDAIFVDPSAFQGTSGRVLTLREGALAAGAHEGLLVGALHDSLQQLVAGQKKRAHRRGHGGEVGRAVLAIDARVPYRTVSSVIYTAGQAEMSEMDALATSADGRGEVAIPIHVPRYAERPEAAPEGPECASIRGVVDDRGVATRLDRLHTGAECRARAGYAPGREPTRGKGTDAADAGGDAPSPPDDWDGRWVVPVRGWCPSVPHVGGELDVQRLRALVSRVGAGAAAPCCPATVSAAQDAAWKRVAASMAALLDGGVEAVSLSVTEPAPPHSCDGWYVLEGDAPVPWALRGSWRAEGKSAGDKQWFVVVTFEGDRYAMSGYPPTEATASVAGVERAGTGELTVSLTDRVSNDREVDDRTLEVRLAGDGTSFELQGERYRRIVP